MLEGDLHAFSVVNLAHEQPNPPIFSPPHHKLTRRGKVIVRRPDTVEGIVIHQTATPYGVTAQQLKDAGGDSLLAKHRRALGVAAHMTAFDTDFAVLGHPLDWYVNHANSLNARSLGLEIEGRFPQLMGTNELLTGKLLHAAQDGLEYLVQEGRRRGMPIRWVWAHRQSSMTRDDDPGQEIWQKLVLGFAGAVLGLRTQPDFVTGGKTIPMAWRRPGKGVA